MSDSSDDLEAFFHLMSDVKPLTQDRIEERKKPSEQKDFQAKRAAAQALSELEIDGLSLNFAPMLKPEDFIEFKQDGVQDSVYRKLRLGKYEIQARLDLHKKTLKQAREDMIRFLHQCQQLDIRTLIIVHGKGKRSNPPALLKSYVAYWLENISDVLCCHTALKQHGGTGAVYVLLKKSVTQKQENRERHLNHRSG